METMKTEHAVGRSISIAFAICLDFNEAPTGAGEREVARGSFTVTKQKQVERVV